MSRTSPFGHVEQLPSRKWRARYTGPDGRRRSATFATKTDARAWLSTSHADLVRRTWRAPELSRTVVGEYACAYMARPDLRPSTRGLYESLWRLHLEPRWSTVPVGDVNVAQVRAWHVEASRTTGPTALAQAYRLLRAVLNVAVADEVISANPCRLRAAATPKAARSTRALAAREVVAVADHTPDRYRVLVLVLAFGGLRFGEATALTRADVAVDGSRLRVERSVRSGVVGDPKTEAGRRTVALPGSVANAVVDHLIRFVPDDPGGLVFGTSNGRYLARQNFGATFRRACQAAGVPVVRVHELRHTGATLAAATGATTKELMTRLGHASAAAALIYQHASDERDGAIAAALDGMLVGAEEVVAP